MKRPAWVSAAAAVGAVAALGVLLSPLAGAGQAADVILPAVLPLGFYAAGWIAAILAPAQPVGHRLLVVGTLHLTAFALGIVEPLAASPAMAWLTGLTSTVAYALGFVALLDALVRYPDGAYGLRWVRHGTRLAAVVTLAVSLAAALGSRTVLSVIQSDTLAPNPYWLPAFEPAVEAVNVVAVLAPIGLVLILARYRSAGPADRAQMRWPIGAVVVLVAGLATTGLLQETLGLAVQSAIFIVIASALPASLLVGLLRYAREADTVALLEASRRRVAEAAVEERKRIERDLHDGAQQQLIALLARIELARRESEPGSAHGAQLAEIAGSVRDVHRELRELARGIFPAILGDRGLAAAVASALGRLPLRTDLSIDPAMVGRRFPPAIEGAAYLFVLEGLTNVMKHSRADRVAVSVAMVDAGLEVAVADAGQGFDAASAPAHALQSLRDRVAAVGGDVLVESRPGAGTNLRGRFPAATLSVDTLRSGPAGD